MSRDSTKLPIPFVCKQLNNLIDGPSGQLQCGHYPVQIGVLVAMVLSSELSDNGLNIQCEDSTGIVQMSYYEKPQIQEFEYIRLFFTITKDSNANPVFLVTNIEPVKVFDQVIAHQLLSYSFYLSHMVPETPHKSYKLFVKEQQALQLSQQQQYASGSSNYSSSFTGLNFDQKQPMNAMMNNNMSNISNAGETLLEAVHNYLTTHNENSDGYSVSDIVQSLNKMGKQCNQGQVGPIISKLLEDGAIFTALDENHFCAL